MCLKFIVVQGVFKPIAVYTRPILLLQIPATNPGTDILLK